MSEPGITLPTIGTQRRAWPFVVATVVFVALGLSVTFSLTGGRSGDVAALPEVKPASNHATADESVAQDEAVEVSEVASLEIFLNRDPFEPVVPEPVSEDQDADEGAGPSPSSPPTPTSPTQTPTPTSPSPGTPASPSDPSPSAPGGVPPSRVLPPDEKEGVVEGRSVSLLDITTNEVGAELVVVQVADAIYEVTEGQRFAEYFAVFSIDGDCASINHGDVRFILCTGESVLQ